MSNGIVFDGVSFSYGGKHILCDYSHIFAEGTVTAIHGVSGCGKTTLLRLVAGLEKPDNGSVIIPEGAKINLLFQEDRLLPWCDAIDNIRFIGADDASARAVLKAVGLENEEETYPSQLSGGMRRRLAIARSLAYGGDIWLLDEPVRGLDEQTKQSVLTALKQALRGKTAIIVTHDAQEAEQIAEQSLELAVCGA